MGHGSYPYPKLQGPGPGLKDASDHPLQLGQFGMDRAAAMATHTPPRRVGACRSWCEGRYQPVAP